MIEQGFLEKILAEYEFECSKQMLEKLGRYAELLVEWNEKINLTAITLPEDIAVKHFLDSLLLLKAVELPDNAQIIDVGTGAGFPSMPVGLYRSDLKITLLDSLQKRIRFLEELSATLARPADCVHGRAEEMGAKDVYREKYDLAAARAVAHLRELAEYCLPFVKVGGVFAQEEADLVQIKEELREAAYAISELGGRVEKTAKFSLPGDNKRAIVVIRKDRPTPAKYPRPSAKMKKFPLQKGN